MDAQETSVDTQEVVDEVEPVVDVVSKDTTNVKKQPDWEFTQRRNESLKKAREKAAKLRAEIRETKVDTPKPKTKLELKLDNAKAKKESSQPIPNDPPPEKTAVVETPDQVVETVRPTVASATKEVAPKDDIEDTVVVKDTQEATPPPTEDPHPKRGNYWFTNKEGFYYL
jgi:hypothetical protein